MVDALPNRQVPTIIKRVKVVVKLYVHHGFSMTTMLVDKEFKPLQPSFPFLNCCGMNYLGPRLRGISIPSRSDQNYVHYATIQESALNHTDLFGRNAVFWLNGFHLQDGVSLRHSPWYLMTSEELDYNLHVCLEFGEYIQTHEEHTNEMEE